MTNLEYYKNEILKQAKIHRNSIGFAIHYVYLKYSIEKDVNDLDKIFTWLYSTHND